MPNARNFFTPEEQKAITAAIEKAELNTSGEIRLHVENKCPEDVLDRAAFIFNELGMTKTEQRNGVLFYLSIKDHKFAVLGDTGINAVVAENFWDDTVHLLKEHFKRSQFAEGLIAAISKAGQSLKKHFPYQTNDINELSNDISFG